MNELNANHFPLLFAIDVLTANLMSIPSLILDLASENICVLANIDISITANSPMKNVNPNGNQKIGKNANIVSSSRIVIPETVISPVHPKKIRMNSVAIPNPNSIPYTYTSDLSSHVVL
jgi:hypothetical protein